MKRMILFVCALLLLGCVGCGEQEDAFASLVLVGRENASLAVNAPLPDAADFLPIQVVQELESRNISVSYAQPLTDGALGEQVAHLRLTAQNGQRREMTVPYCGVVDNIAPTLSGLRDRSAVCGEGLVLREGIEVQDNCIGELSLHVDASEVDTEHAGVYQVTYTVSDAAGNTATYRSSVYIYEAEVTEAMLFEKTDELLDRIVSENMSREEICRGIYACVQASMAYIVDADQSDWVRAAYTSLYVSGRGDCFGYFSAAKALLERAGIEYLEIQRTPGYTEDTHYWLLVNIAEQGEAEQWYYFDPTELRRDEHYQSGCLLTLAQIEAYDAIRPYFYLHDATALPEVATRVITATPGFERE